MLSDAPGLAVVMIAHPRDGRVGGRDDLFDHYGARLVIDQQANGRQMINSDTGTF